MYGGEVMKCKDIKRTYFVFLPYECVAAEEYLELMAEAGWLLQAVKGPFLKFERLYPQKIKYSVDILHKVSMFDRKDSDVALEYRDYCQTAGWTYLCQKGKEILLVEYKRLITMVNDGLLYMGDK